MATAVGRDGRHHRDRRHRQRGRPAREGGRSRARSCAAASRPNWSGRARLFRARQPVMLKGKREPVEVWEAVALRRVDAETAADVTAAGRPRRRDWPSWRRYGATCARRPEAHVVVLCGEAGSGKTRLVNELARRWRGRGHGGARHLPRLRAMGGARVAAEVLRQLGPADDDEVMARVRSLAGDTDKSLRAIDPAACTRSSSGRSSACSRRRSADRPLVVVLDDVHRSGEQLLAAPGRAGRAAHGVPHPDRAGRADRAERLADAVPSRDHPAPGAARPADAATLAGRLRLRQAARPEAAAFLVERAGGNPLYLRELVRMARAGGSLVDDGDCYRLRSAAAVPATLQALSGGPPRRRGSGAQAGPPARRRPRRRATAEQIAGVGSPQRRRRAARPGRERPAAPRPRRRLRGRRSDASGGRLRDASPQRPGRAAPPGRGHRRRRRRAGPPPRPGRPLPGRRRVGGDGGGRGPGRPPGHSWVVPASATPCG